MTKADFIHQMPRNARHLSGNIFILIYPTLKESSSDCNFFIFERHQMRRSGTSNTLINTIDNTYNIVLNNNT